MTMINTNSALGDLVTKQPGFAPILEELDLDYCCGGGRSLAAACFAGGHKLEDVVERLSAHQPAAAEEWTSMDAPELVEHLERTHHVYLKEALPRLSTLMERVVVAHGERHPELHEVSRVLAELRADLEPHLMKEEQILFPMVRQLFAAQELPTFHCGTLQNPIGVMEAEHDRVGQLLAQLRTLTSGHVAPGDGCASYQALYAGLAELEADTHLHVHKENNVLFPAVGSEESQRGSVG